MLNHEVVKYFTNEKKELIKFNTYLQRIQLLNIDSTYAIAILNFGQATLFCAGLTASLVIALNRVSIGVMSVGKQNISYIQYILIYIYIYVMYV